MKTKRQHQTSADKNTPHTFNKQNWNRLLKAQQQKLSKLKTEDQTICRASVSCRILKQPDTSVRWKPVKQGERCRYTSITQQPSLVFCDDLRGGTWRKGTCTCMTDSLCYIAETSIKLCYPFNCLKK